MTEPFGDVQTHVKITSAYQRERPWEGDVPVPEELADEARLEWLFRYFNRVDEGDVRRLDRIGFDQPSMTAGDLIELDGESWRCAAFGFEKVGARK